VTSADFAGPTGGPCCTAEDRREPDVARREGRVTVAATEITGIAVPVPEAQAYASHPHITLLAPFRPRNRLDDHRLRKDLRRFFARVAPFSFALVASRRFPDGIDYLAPEPADPFRTMTAELADRFPDCPPYGGQFDSVIPHLTVDRAVPTDVLPIRGHATVAQLVHSYAQAWDVVDTFGFRG
jgi:hypothetical protein